MTSSKQRYSDIRKIGKAEPAKHALRLDAKQYPDMCCGCCTCGERLTATTRAALSDKFYAHVCGWEQKR